MGTLRHKRENSKGVVNELKENISVLDLINDGSHTYTIEIFPPKEGENMQKLMDSLRLFCQLGVRSVNITCKPGDGEPTLSLTQRIREEFPELVLIPHIAVISLFEGNLGELLAQYKKIGITNLFLVRGDFPDGEYRQRIKGTYASELVKQVRSQWPEVSIGVAGYPEQHIEERNWVIDMFYLKKKVESGADYVITQLFFENDAYFTFRERCALFGITVPIIPGITMIKNTRHLKRLKEIAQGSSFPQELEQRIRDSKDDAEAKEHGTIWCEEQAEGILASPQTPQLHFYIFNGIAPFDEIIKCIRKKQTQEARAQRELTATSD